MASVAVLLLLYSDCLKAEPLAGHLPAFRRLQLEPTPPNLFFPGETSDLASSQCLGFPRCSVRVPRVEPQKFALAREPWHSGKRLRTSPLRRETAHPFVDSRRMGLAAWISTSARVRLLRSAWWCDQAQFFHDHLKIFPGLFLLARIAQQESRVIGYGKLGSAEVVPAAAQLGHGRIDGEQRLGSHSAEGHDGLGLDNLDLPKQVWRAGFAFFALGSAIARWTALDDVGDINVFAAQSHRLDHVIQQLSGATDEWLALNVFVGTGSFTDEHQIGTRIAYAKDNLLASLFVQGTASAVAEVFTDETQGGDGVDGWFR